MTIMESSDNDDLAELPALEPTEVILAGESSANQVVQSVTTTPQQMSDDEILAFTQNARIGIASKLLANGKIPEDKSDRNLLTNVLDGLDRQVINKKRVDAEVNQANELAAATLSITNLLNTVARDVYTAGIPVERTLPEIPMECVTLVEAKLVEGELSGTYVQETIEDFKKRTDNLKD